MKSIIAAAWFGTRMLPITKTIPKELMPVWKKPVIQYIVEWIAWCWIKDIIMITSNGKEALENYFDKNHELETLLAKKWKTELLEEINKTKNIANICFVKQKQPIWFWDAVLQAKPWINEEFFLLSIWDTIFDGQIFKDLMNKFEKEQNPLMVLQEIPWEKVSSYGVVKVENNKITDIVEKPQQSKAPSNLIISWIYILPYKIFELIENLSIDNKTWEIMLTDAMLQLTEYYDIIPMITSHKIRDVGTHELWLKANNDLFQD